MAVQDNVDLAAAQADRPGTNYVRWLEQIPAAYWVIAAVMLTLRRREGAKHQNPSIELFEFLGVAENLAADKAQQKSDGSGVDKDAAPNIQTGEQIQDQHQTEPHHGECSNRTQQNSAGTLA